MGYQIFSSCAKLSSLVVKIKNDCRSLYWVNKKKVSIFYIHSIKNIGWIHNIKHICHFFALVTSTENIGKGAVIFKAGYRGGRIFGGVPNFLASFYWGIKYLEKNVKCLMGCKISGKHLRLK